MGATTGIEWADATVNVWEGCTKVSPACKHCYAETNSPVRAMEVRIGEALGVEPSADGKRRMKMWGQSGFRYETASWEGQLRALNRRERHMREQFGTEHVRRRVFINSLSDTFEDWQGPVYRLDEGKPVVVAQSLDDVRARFFRVAEECTELDILLLTKRPENVLQMVPASWLAPNVTLMVNESVTHRQAGWPSRVWLGATVEDQEHADKRIPELLNVPARVRFLSVEPLLGEVDIGPWVRAGGPQWQCHYCKTYHYEFGDPYGRGDCPRCKEVGALGGSHELNGKGAISWVIVGGESGGGARPVHPDWVRSIRDQCQAAGVPFFFKQWGEWAPSPEIGLPYHFEDGDHAFRIGKKTAGRLLDGRTWEEQPK